MLNWIFILFIVSSTILAAWTGKMEAVTDAGIKSAKSAVELAISLIGQMAVWLGLMRVLRDGGFMRSVARMLSPVMTRLFKDVPPDHPAMGAMIMNLAANMAGLGNAATPFGLKAMQELDKLNPRKGVSTNAMSLFLAINTSGVAVLPLGVIAVRAAAGSKNPAGITLPSIFATTCSTLVAILVCKLVERSKLFSPERYPATEPAAADPAAIKGMAEAEETAAERPKPKGWKALMVPAYFVVMIAAVVVYVTGPKGADGLFAAGKDVLSFWLLPFLMALIVVYGVSRSVEVYAAFVTGAKEGWNIAVMIIPYLAAILVSIGVFRASGGMEAVTAVLRPLTDLIGMPPETLPMAIIRPLSGNGALGVLSDALKSYGPDSFIAFAISVMNGSTETTFYVLALYFGSVGVKATRHTVIPCLAAEGAGMWSAVMWARLFF